MQYGHPVPCDHVREGVYIVDRALVAVLRRGRVDEDRKLVAELVERTESAYAEAGLVRHAAEEVRGAETAVIWGCSVDGKGRTVRSAWFCDAWLVYGSTTCIVGGRTFACWTGCSRRLSRAARGRRHP